VRSITFFVNRCRIATTRVWWVLATAISVAALACGSTARPPAAASGETRGARVAALLAESIRLDTTNPPGHEAELAEHLALFLRGEGVATQVIPLPEPGSPRAALWARVPGTGRGRPLILLSHLDVVPAEAETWTVDPFAGVVGGGFVVGRGALDAKGVAVTHAFVLAELARQGAAPLARDVILLATPDEEAGGREGAALIAGSRPDLLAGAEWLLTEGGGILPGEAGSPDVWGVAFTEKTPCWLTLRAAGVPGHGAGASGDAATHRLVAALARVAALRFETRVVPEVAQMFEALAPLAAPEDRAGYASLRGALALDPGFRARFLADGGRAALVRTTAAITTLSGSERINVLPAEARAGIDARLLPGQSCEELATRVREAIADPAVSLRIDLSFAAHASPTDTALMEAMRRVAAKSSPAGVVVPRVIAGFTDAHWFRARGIVSYGFVPRRLRPLETRGVHGVDERISIENLELGIDATLAILRELDAVEAMAR
jgi:acetylornithine deacetylase/succinyl-diaminopimelate desuccinylase-like protein